MGIVNNQGVFIAPPLGEGEDTTITSFRDDDDFSTDLFDESIVLPSFPDNIGIAFVKTSESPADYATIALQGTNTSTIYADNTSSDLNFVVSGDTFVGYNQGANLDLIRISFLDYVPSLSSDLFVEGKIYTGGGWNFRDTTLRGITGFGSTGSNIITINEDGNSIDGVGIITASQGDISKIYNIDTITGNSLKVSGITSISGQNLVVSGITSISGQNLVVSGITTITPSVRLNINGNLNVSGVSTVGIASTSNLTTNSTFTFELTNNTTLRIRVRGTDGVVRTGIVTLS